MPILQILAQHAKNVHKKTKEDFFRDLKVKLAKGVSNHNSRDGDGEDDCEDPFEG